MMHSRQTEHAKCVVLRPPVFTERGKRPASRMFASENGGRVAARLYSLVMSCKLAGVNVEEYLRDVLVALSETPACPL